MKYALINSERQEAQPGLSGKCDCCDSPVIAKCGKVKIWHWAHSGKKKCDSWKEPETEWHREWKDQFPKEWQEIIHPAENGDKHRADVKTDQGYVIEFQHSPIKLEECQSREGFYIKMIWIVNGTRRLRDKNKFIDVWEQSIPFDNKVQARKLVSYLDDCALLRDWHSSKAPVFFDFGEDILLGLLPKGFLLKTIEEKRYVFKIKRNELISYFLPASQMSFEALMKSFHDFFLAKETLSAVQQNLRSQRTNYSLSRYDRRRKVPL
jgi:hypothetical protein